MPTHVNVELFASKQFWISFMSVVGVVASMCGYQLKDPDTWATALAMLGGAVMSVGTLVVGVLAARAPAEKITSVASVPVGDKPK